MIRGRRETMKASGLARLHAANKTFAKKFPGELSGRQPVHTVYGGAHLFGADIARKLGDAALRALTEYGLPQAWLMRFALRVMGNLTDGRTGDFQDRLMYSLERLARAS